MIANLELYFDRQLNKLLFRVIHRIVFHVLCDCNCVFLYLHCARQFMSQGWIIYISIYYLRNIATQISNDAGTLGDRCGILEKLYSGFLTDSKLVT
jgi:hypothetical protein